MLSLSASTYRVFSLTPIAPSDLVADLFRQHTGHSFYGRRSKNASRQSRQLACWIMALIQKASFWPLSMREPDIGLSGIILWGLEHRKQDKRAGTITFHHQSAGVDPDLHPLRHLRLCADCTVDWSDLTTRETETARRYGELTLVLIVLAVVHQLEMVDRYLALGSLSHGKQFRKSPIRAGCDR